MSFTFLKSKANQFLLKLVLVYGGWKVVHYLVTHSEKTNLWWNKLICSDGSFYASLTSYILNLFGENTTHSGINVIYHASQKSITVAEHCLAIPAMVVFTGVILLFPGSSKNKFWFIPAGLFCIFLINLMRIVFVCAAFEHLSETFYRINHSLVYVIVTYSLILAMMIFWMEKFGESKLSMNKSV